MEYIIKINAYPKQELELILDNTIWKPLNKRYLKKYFEKKINSIKITAQHLLRTRHTFRSLKTVKCY